MLPLHWDQLVLGDLAPCKQRPSFGLGGELCRGQLSHRGVLSYVVCSCLDLQPASGCPFDWPPHCYCFGPNTCGSVPAELGVHSPCLQGSVPFLGIMLMVSVHPSIRQSSPRSIPPTVGAPGSIIQLPNTKPEQALRASAGNHLVRKALWTDPRWKLGSALHLLLNRRLLAHSQMIIKTPGGRRVFPQRLITAHPGN